VAVAFAHLALLPLAALAALPVLIHLLMRRRPRTFDFSSLRFLQSAEAETRRMRRPRDLAVLALRTLFVLALALTFARPVLFTSSALLAGSRGPRDVVLVVDRSLSMGYNERGLIRFAGARARAAEILDSLGAGSRADLVWLDSACEAVFGTPSPNLAALKAELERAEASFSAARPEAALARARAILERPVSDGSGRAREIYVISDFQASNWEGVPRRPPAGTPRVFEVFVGQDGAANAAVEGIWASPAAPVAGEALNVSVQVANYSGTRIERRVTLEAGSSRQERRVGLDPRARATVEFRLAAPESSDLEVAATIDEDGLPADNRRCLALHVAPAIEVGMISGGSSGARYLRAALSPAAGRGQVALRELAADAFSANSPSGPAQGLIFLCGWNGAEAERVREWLASGKAVVWMLGADGPVSTALLDAVGARAEVGATLTRPDREPGRLSPALPDDRLLAVFRDGASGDLSAPVFRKYRRLAVRGGQVLLRYDDGQAALARLAACGSTLFLWNMPLDPAASDLAGSNVFLPLLRELVAQNRGPARATAFTAGQSISLETSLAVDPQKVTVEPPGDKRRPARVVPGARWARLESDGAEVPGFYRFREGQRLIGVLAVNTPPAESDLRLLSPNRSEKGGAFSVAEGESVTRLREGTPCWPALLVLALLALAGECTVLLFWKPRV